MNYLLYRLRFLTPVHFGGSNPAQSLSQSHFTLCADTLFSALCHASMQLEGETGLNALCEMVRKGALRLSDALPYKQTRFYLPRPCLEPSVRREFSSSDRKVLKKVDFLAAENFSNYVAGLFGEEAIHPNELRVHFGQSYLVEKAHVALEEDALPYPVGLFRFDEDAGLYFIAACGDSEVESTLQRYLTVLGIGGIGGKITSGYGKFQLEAVLSLANVSALRELLNFEEKPDYLMTLCASLPREDELRDAMEGASYRLIRRSGFVQSADVRGEAKKKTQYFFAAGSIFQRAFEGNLYQVAPRGCHPVYRYGLPLFLGVHI